MRSFFPKAGWMLAGVLALYVLSALAGIVSGGDLDPPGAPAPTMKTLADIPPSWHRLLPSEDGDVDGCNSGRFGCVFNGEAILDRETGLVWQQEPSEQLGEWRSAMQACAAASTGGRYGWRLPTFEELASLFDTSADYFPDGHPFTYVPGVTGNFWSSTTLSPGDGARSFQLDTLPDQSPANAAGKDFEFRAWCVRGGTGHNEW